MKKNQEEKKVKGEGCYSEDLRFFRNDRCSSDFGKSMIEMIESSWIPKMVPIPVKING